MRSILVFILLIPLGSISQLRLAKIFSDNMVIQRDKPVHIWGKAVPGKNISVFFGKEKKNVKAGADSIWNIVLKARALSTRPQTLTVVSGTDKIYLQNILIGDLWLCIGQSNMEWPMLKELHYKEELSSSSQPLLRFYSPAYAGKNIFSTVFSDSVVQLLTKENFYKGKWQQSDSSSFKAMSAVAYYYGKKIANEMNVPVGLINLSIGGAPLETFISYDALRNSKQFLSKLNGDWLINDKLPTWVRERGNQNIPSQLNVPYDEYGKNHAFKPGFAYEAGIKPLLPMQIKGIICYQGESNAQEKDRVNEYEALSVVMVNDYRQKWKQPQLPFYFVQLSSIDTAKYKGQLWPEFRNEQRKMLERISYTGMAVCTDIGFKDDVHPTNKKDVGERLARWALNKTYKQNIIPSGPLPLNAKYENGRVIISFQFIAKGLETSDGGQLKGFSVDGKNEIEAIIGDSGILINVKLKPEFVFYGWKPFSDGNLVNSEKLPASTFKIKVE